MILYFSPQTARARAATVWASRSGVRSLPVCLDSPSELAQFPEGDSPLRLTDFVDEDLIGQSVASLGSRMLPYLAIPAIATSGVLDGSCGIFIEPSCVVCGDLDDVFERIRSEGDLLVPTLLNPSFSKVPELRIGFTKQVPTSPDRLLKTLSPINDAIIGLQPGSSQLLREWPLSVGHLSHYTPTSSKAMRRWLTAMVVSHGVKVSSDPGVGLGYFNLRERQVSARGDAVTVNGSDLKILDLRRFDPEAPELLKRGQDVGWLSEQPALYKVTQAYARDLKLLGPLEAEFGDTEEEALLNTETAWARSHSNFYWSKALRNAYFWGVCEGILSRPPFTAEGERNAIDFFLSPAPVARQSGLNMILWRLWVDSPELNKAYPVLNGADGPGYLGWVWKYGRDQCLIPDALVPAMAESYAHGHY